MLTRSLAPKERKSGPETKKANTSETMNLRQMWTSLAQRLELKKARSHCLAMQKNLKGLVGITTKSLGGNDGNNHTIGWSYHWSGLRS